MPFITEDEIIEIGEEKKLVSNGTFLSPEDVVDAAPIQTEGTFLSPEDVVSVGEQTAEDSWPKVIGKGLMQGATFVPKAIGAGAKVLEETFGTKDKTLLGIPFRGGLLEKSEEAEKFWQPETGESRAKDIVAQTGRTWGQMGTALPLGGLPLMAIGAGMIKTEEALEGGASLPKAIGAGVIQAATEYLTEKIPLKVLQAPGLSFLKRLAGGLISDVPGELVATATEMALIDEQILGKKYTVDDYKKALIDTIAVSGLTTLGATTVAHPFTKGKTGEAPEPQAKPAAGVEATEDILAEGEQEKQEYIKKKQAFTVEDQLKTKQPEVYDQLKKEAQDDKGIRKDERQIPEGGIAQESGAEKGSPNLEQQTSGQPGGEEFGQKTEIAGRRQDFETRKKVAEMTSEEMQSALLTDELTGLKNKRAYTEAVKKPVQVKSDVDGLKWINDNYGEDAGNALLKAKADALKAEGIDAYRTGGDEYYSQFDSPEQADAVMKNVAKRLESGIIEYKNSDGATLKYSGGRFSYGIGRDTASADAALRASKEVRERAGERAGRGDKPIGLVEVAEGKRMGEAGGKAVSNIPGEVEPLKANQKGILELNRSQRQTLEAVKAEIEQGEPAKRQVARDELTGEVTTAFVEGGTYPDYFKGKGYTKKDALNAINKVLNNQPLTENQRIVVEDLNKGFRRQATDALLSEHEKKIAPQKSAWDLKEGDKFKIEGENFKVTDVNQEGFLPEVTVKDGKTYRLKGDEIIKYDKGSFKKAEAETSGGAAADVGQYRQPSLESDNIESMAKKKGKGNIPTAETLKPEGKLKKVTLYHGTDSSVAGKIDTEGLRFGDFLTANKQEALDYAKMRAKQRGTKPIVKEFTFNQNEVEYNRGTGEWQYRAGKEAFKGGKYPDKIYQALNETWGSNLTKVEIDKLPFNEVRDNASMGLEGGRAEFDKLVKTPETPGGAAAEAPTTEQPGKDVTLDMLGLQNVYEATIKLFKKVDPKNTPDITVVKKKGDLGLLKSLIASPNMIGGKARYYVIHAKNAVHKQDRLRGLVDEKLNEIYKTLKSKELRQEFEAISWMGDLEEKTFTADELDDIGVNPTVKEAYLKHRKLHDQVWRLLAAHRKMYGGETGYREGHIPHLFENWNVYEMTKKANESGEMREVPAGIVGSFRSLREASNFANGLDPSKKYLIKPKTFKMPDELIAKTVMKDVSFDRLVDKVEQAFSLTREDAKEMVNEIARRKNRRRFFGNLVKRTGQTGFKKDDLYGILKHYYNSSARYVALDDLKARLVPKFEKDFGVELGRASQALRDKNIAQYVEDYFNDVNGVPGMTENLMDASIKWAFGDMVRSERPSIWAVNKALHFTGAVKLGLLNLSAGVVNLTQLINTFSKVPANHFAWAFERVVRTNVPGISRGMRQLPHIGEFFALNPKERAILRRIGIEYDLGLGDTGGYSMTHKAGKLIEGAMYFFTKAEYINRATTALAAYRYAKKDLHYSEKQARIYARELVDKTQFDYSVADTARIFRSPAGRLLGQFKPFAIKQIEFITGLKGAEHIKFWVPLLLMAGTAGIPLIEGLNDFIEWLTGKDILLETKAYLMRWAGSDKDKKKVAEVAMYGVLSQLGIDISKRVGTGDVLPKKATDLLGPTINTLMQAKRIMEKGDKTEFIRNIAPSVGNLITAIETVLNNMEVRDPWRRQHLKYVAKPSEVVAKGLGLRPLREAEMADIEQIRQYETNKYTKLQQKYVDQAVEALMSGNAEGVASAITKAAEAGVIIDDGILQNEILQRVLPQDMRMLLKTRMIQKSDYLELMDFGGDNGQLSR